MACSSAIAALSCGTDALMFGSLMMFASGVSGEVAEFGERIADPLIVGEPVGERGEDPPGERDVSRLDLDVGRAGERLDDRQERVRGQCRRLVGVRVDDGRLVFHLYPH